MLLVVGVVFLGSDGTALTRSAFAPILFPVDSVQVEDHDVSTHFLCLFRAFPATKDGHDDSGQRSVFINVAYNFLRSRLRAARTAISSFELLLRSYRSAAPNVVVVVNVCGFRSRKLNVPHAFILTSGMFLRQVGVKVAVVSGQDSAVLRRTLCSN